MHCKHGPQRNPPDASFNKRHMSAESPRKAQEAQKHVAKPSRSSPRKVNKIPPSSTPTKRPKRPATKNTPNFIAILSVPEYLEIRCPWIELQTARKNAKTNTPTISTTVIRFRSIARNTWLNCTKHARNSELVSSAKSHKLEAYLLGGRCPSGFRMSRGAIAPIDPHIKVEPATSAPAARGDHSKPVMLSRKNGNEISNHTSRDTMRQKNAPDKMVTLNLALNRAETVKFSLVIRIVDCVNPKAAHGMVTAVRPSMIPSAP
mmetsp:Transcript_4499/g.8975  ORF Transcript_4499/g.8975 Transcript_4499/m.8975 type:complete len:261 (-) Transcript_4499:707-1489(-)